MKRLALILFLLPAPALACEDGSKCRSLIHAGSGTTVSYVAIEITEREWAGPVAACGAGAFKEWGIGPIKIDKNADLRDFAEWCVGGVLGAVVNAMLVEEDSRLRFTGALETAGDVQEGLFVKWTVVRW